MFDIAVYSDPWFTDTLTTDHMRMIDVDALHRALHDLKVASKALFERHGAVQLWNVLRDHVLSYDLWIFAGFPALALEALLPAEEESPGRRTSFWQDYSYPVLGAIFAAPFTSLFISGITAFYKAHLSFLNTALLDGKPMWLQLLGAFLLTDLVLYFSHFVR
ncbi:MAG TPA: hypothetical protein VGT98_10630, partial [Candidatus Elarobacter sp.]|nr:hypothetical protein [Candidatus Elarobacter sp.]